MCHTEKWAFWVTVPHNSPHPISAHLNDPVSIFITVLPLPVKVSGVPADFRTVLLFDAVRVKLILSAKGVEDLCAPSQEVPGSIFPFSSRPVVIIQTHEWPC